MSCSVSTSLEPTVTCQLCCIKSPQTAYYSSAVFGGSVNFVANHLAKVQTTFYIRAGIVQVSGYTAGSTTGVGKGNSTIVGTISHAVAAKVSNNTCEVICAGIAHLQGAGEGTAANSVSSAWFPQQQ